MIRKTGLIDRRQLTRSIAAGLALPALSRLALAQGTETVLDAQPIPSLPRSAQAASGINSEDLKPGEFIFEPDLAPDGPVVFIVSIPEQRVHVYRNGVEIGVSTCSTGKPGHTTPTGVFVILQKDKHHHSSTYNNAPMPNMQRLTWGGIALHAGNLPGYPASHGCVRLPLEFSKLIFEITHLGIPVIIADAKSQPARIVHPGLLLPAQAEEEAKAALLAAAEKSHHGADATTDSHDVTSVVISGADQKAIVLTDGELVWESDVQIHDPDRPLGNHVYKLLGLAKDRSSFDWIAHTIHGDELVNSRSDDVFQRIRFVKWQESIPLFANMIPGSSLVVTDLSADEDTRSGPDFIVMRGEDGDI